MADDDAEADGRPDTPLTRTIRKNGWHPWLSTLMLLSWVSTLLTFWLRIRRLACKAHVYVKADRGACDVSDYTHDSTAKT